MNTSCTSSHSMALPESQRDILGMIATNHQLHDILTAICLMIDAQDPGTLCSVLLTDAQGKHLLKGAAPGLPPAYSEAIHGMPIGPREGTCGTAAFRRELVVTADIARDPSWERFRSLALGYNLRSCWSLPLLSHQGCVLGTFALYQDQAVAPSEAQIERLTCAARLAAIAIRHERDGQRLEESEQRFRSLFTYYERQLSINANHDRLTGLLNRLSLEGRLGLECRSSRQRKCHLAVMYIDLDGFKSINDSIGHYFGDQVLIEVAQRMTQQVRPTDTVVRMGGDEFVVLLTDLLCDEDVVPVAERLLASIGKPYCIHGIDLHVSASIGITLSDGHIGQPMQLIQQADMAMYKAKQQGRNNFEWYTSDLNQRVCEHRSLRNDLQKALETRSFSLHYQPQIEARTGRVVGIEALLRWEHPVRGFISPAVFVPVAEDSGQIVPLSLWVLETACAQLRNLCDQGFTDISMAVNISPMHFQRGQFVECIQAVLSKHGLSAGQLELEITESLLLHNVEHAIATLHRLKNLGVRIALDDFGTGFSSLSYLKRLPIDKIKIDRSFIQDISTNPHDAAITQGIISMAHHLGLSVVAEGVETAPQVDFLESGRCDIFQGYYFARPMSHEALRIFLADGRTLN
ncbi:GGDEF domain-containing protein [Pseudomonas sp. TWI628]|uniref:putative bifunctional diguanylate cyclase/phosphodiesterase n=1 Tax=Pseudomonas sp. TWI628 TaxID=3136788 RepID=UPI00320B1979